MSNITIVDFGTDDSQSSMNFSKSFNLESEVYSREKYVVSHSYIVFQSIYNKQSVTIYYHCVRLYTTTPFTLKKTT